MEEEHKEKTDVNWICIGIISGIDCFAVLIYILLVVRLFRAKNENKSSFILQLQIILSCFFHQLSYTPTYFTFINNDFKIKTCNLFALVNNATNFLTMILGAVFAFVLYQLSKEIIIKLSNVIIISILSWVFSIIISYYFVIYGKVDIDADTICWFQYYPINISILSFNFVLSILTSIFFTKTNIEIKKYIQEKGDIENYDNRIKQFISITILTFLLTISCIIPLINAINNKILTQFFMFLEDYLDCLIYPMFALTYCYTDDNMIKEMFCCDKPEHSPSIRPSSLFYNESKVVGKLIDDSVILAMM